MRILSKHPGWILWCAALIWCALLFALALESGEASGALSGGFTEKLLRLLGLSNLDPREAEGVIRKLAHFAGFLGLGALVYAALSTSFDSGMSWVVGIAIGIAACVANELAQLLPIGRGCDARDMAIDFAGYALGCWCVAAVKLIIRQVKRKREF